LLDALFTFAVAVTSPLLLIPPRPLAVELGGSTRVKAPSAYVKPWVTKQLSSYIPEIVPPWGGKTVGDAPGHSQTKSVQKPSSSGAPENDALSELFPEEIHRRENRR